LPIPGPDGEWGTRSDPLAGRTLPVPRLPAEPRFGANARPQRPWPDAPGRPRPRQPERPPAREHGPALRRRRLARWVRTVLVVLSALTLLVTGYGWSVYRQLNSSLVTSDVIAPAAAADGATDILLVGLDSRTDANGNPLPQQVFDALHAGPDTGTMNTDTLILVRIPNDPKKPSTAVSIPRDSYVNIPGYGTHKINSAYARAATTERTRLAAQGVTGPALDQQANQAGRRSLIATVEQLTGASVDHYAEVNLVGFADITTAVGGVPVCLKAPVNDSYSGADFPAGPQTLEGAPALAFVRQRHGLPRGDLDRIVRQQAFMASLAHKVLSAGTLTNPAAVSRLITTISQYVVLDHGWDLLGFASQVQGLTGGNISFRTIPTGTLALPTPSDGVAVQVNPTLVRQFVSGLSGQQPAAPDPAAAPAIGDVSNASGRTGLAAGVQNLLDDHGVVPGAVGNAPGLAHSVIRASAANQTNAQQIAQLLGGLPVQLDDTVPAGHVQVLLGRDYAGPDTAGAAVPSVGGSTAAPAPGDDAHGAPAADAPAITAAGVPCIN
jgi:LCP family protein required for cell wall assembly